MPTDPRTDPASSAALVAALEPWRRALYDFDADALRAARKSTFADDAPIQLGHPFETLDGPGDLVDTALLPLVHAMPDMERRDTIVVAGRAGTGTDWVGCCGYWCGTFERPWLGIPPTHRVATMRFHEFYRVLEGRVVEFQGIWDIPELMMQAGAWPMAPSLGREWHVPGPVTQDGLARDPAAAARTGDSFRIVSDMLTGLGEHASGGVEAMGLERYWHPRSCWYGPSGIGTSRTIGGFRDRHQIPFLNALPDRTGGTDGRGHLFADADYVAFTGWPGMSMTVTGDGWLGIAPADQRITMRSLDFWRVERGLIRENWVLIDLMHVYHQLGVDVLGRMRELAHPGLHRRAGGG